MSASLTVCIPTFNRAEFLHDCLEAFVPLVEPHGIPICVSDNGSTDNTLAMLEDFRRTRYPLLSYQAATENRGIDQNMVDVVNMACTKYAWLFGDDDLPEPHAIEKVLACLRREPTLLIVNASTHNADLTETIEERRVRIFVDRMYGPGELNRLLADTAAYISYLG